MKRSQFVGLSLVAFALVLLSFVVLGFGRLVLGYRTARLLAAPVGFVAFTLVVGLTLVSVFSKLGVVDVDE